MKPIPFNADRVRAILEGCKTVTRRIVKPQPYNPWFNQVINPLDFGWYDSVPGATSKKIYCNYKLDDILYVQEVWDNEPITPDGNYKWEGVFYYKADGDLRPFEWREAWKSPIYMPREGARIFLRVKDLKVQRVQDITDEEARKEGCKDRDDFHRVWNDCYAKPRPVKVKGVIHHYECYPWVDIQETKTYRGKQWYIIGNPWIWVIEFERCEKPEEAR